QEECKSLDRDLDQPEVNREDRRVEIAVAGGQVQHCHDDEHEGEVVHEVEVRRQHERVRVVVAPLRDRMLVPLLSPQANIDEIASATTIKPQTQQWRIACAAASIAASVWDRSPCAR